MRTHLALCALALAATTPPSLAQAEQPRPRGGYERQCTNIRMEGQFLHATCRGPNGPAVSSINVLSCASEIGVDGQGGLVCSGSGAAGPMPGIYPPPRPPLPGPGPGPGYGRDSVTLYGARGLRGPSVRIAGPTPNLSASGLNDRVGSIGLDRRSGPWIVCTDANYRGRCTTVNRSVADVRDIGMRNAISSLRPAR